MVATNENRAVRASEWVVIGYFAYLGILSWIRPAARSHSQIALVAAGVIGTVLGLAQLPAGPVARAARDWLPAGYLVCGYWLSGSFFLAPMPSVERWLGAVDDGLAVRFGMAGVLARVPRPVLELFELAYLACVPLIPAGFALLVLAGHRESADCYWIVVLMARFGCYAMLPWIQTRPPRALEGPGVVDRRRVAVRRLNLWVLGRASIQVNTVPSGHAATALAAGLALFESVPVAGVGFLVLALGVMTGAVLGRYHFTVDVAAGAPVAVAAAGVARLAGI